MPEEGPLLNGGCFQPGTCLPLSHSFYLVCVLVRRDGVLETVSVLPTWGPGLVWLLHSWGPPARARLSPGLPTPSSVGRT